MKIDKQKLEIAMANSCITFGELSKKSGVSQFTITRMQGNVETHPATVGKIAKALNVSAQEIVQMDAATSCQSRKRTDSQLNNK